MTVEPVQSPVDDTALDPDNPWPGLLTFREQDAQFFQGRKHETEELLRLALRTRLTVLFGVSGLGKSSLLHAGLFPRLRARNILPVYLRPDLSSEQPKLTDQVFEAIAAAAAAAQVEAPERQPGDTLWEYLHRRDADFWNPRNRIVRPLLVFDQFEELFTLGRSSPERAAATETFIDDLVDLIEGRPPAQLKERLDQHPDDASAFDFTNHDYKLIFSLREDFLPDLESIRHRTGAVGLNRMRLRPMTGTAAMEVVNQPHLIEPDVAERVVRSVAAAKDEDQPLESLRIEPALLSVVCRELNLKRQLRGDALITMGLVKANEKQIVSNLYERTMSGLAPEVRIFVEEQLLTASGYRDSEAVENVLGQPGITEQALNQLVDGRLVRVDKRGEVNRLELTHDLLTGVIVASRDERRQREAKAEELRARLAAEERERQVRRKLRRSQAIGLAFLLLALFAAGSAMVALNQRSAALAAEQAAQQALARTHMASAVRLINTGRSDQALAYLGRALRADPASLAARSWLSDLLLRKRWVLPSSPVLQHGDQVTVANFDRAGNRIVTGSLDQTARIWDAATGEALGTALELGSAIYSVALSPDEKRLATAAEDGTARLWDVETGAPAGRVMAHGGPVYSVAFSADQKWLVTASEDNTARLWDAATGEPAHAPWRHEARVNMAVFGAAGQVLTASADGTARVWDTVSGQAVGGVLSHGGPVTSVAFSADGRLAATASDDGTARVWRTATWQPFARPIQHPAPVTSVAFAPDGQHLVTASADNSARVWDLSTGAQLGVRMEHGEAVYSAVFSTDGRRLVTASRDGSARLWNPWTGEPISEPLHHDAPVSLATFSAAGGQVLTASWDGTARVWNAIAGAAIGETYVHDRPVIEAAFSADGQRLLTVPDDDAARLWNVDSMALVSELRHDGRIIFAAFSPDGRRIVTTSRDDTALVWDAATGSRLGEALTHEDTVTSAAFSPDSALIVTTSRDDTARLWDAATGNPAGEIMRHEKTVIAAAFSADGTRVVTASQDSTARLWDARTGEPVGAPLAHQAPVIAVAFSPGEQKMVTGTQAGIGRVWDADSGTPVGSPLRHEARLSEVRFSPDGRQILTASWDGSAQLWDATTGAPVGKPMKHDERVMSARFSPDGRRVATASRDNTARIWDAQTGAPLSTPLRHDATVNSAAFSPDGRRLVTASRGGLAGVWDVLLGTGDDAGLLAELAESIGGYEISDLGTVLRVTDQKRRLTQLAAKGASAPGNTASAASLVDWMLSDVYERRISPLSGMTADDYIAERLDPADARQFCRLEREFPGHPLLASWPPCKRP